jgi:hypothetical protein
MRKTIFSVFLFILSKFEKSSQTRFISLQKKRSLATVKTVAKSAIDRG